MSKIISIGTSTPAYRHQQEDIMHFMEHIYAMNETDKRKLRFLYHHSGINTRYSVVPYYNRPLPEWKFYPHSENLEPFPSLEMRMVWYQKHAPALSVDAIRRCAEGYIHTREISHLITVSCTGMSAPGLDLQVMELLDLPKNIFRTSVNFMGCYAAIHAMKMADAICRADAAAKVMIVCTELCTLHFQKEATPDNIASSLLFGDGSAAMLMTGDGYLKAGLPVKGFYSEVVPRGKKDMAWELSGTGFLMTLSGYVPDLLGEDFEALTDRALQSCGSQRKEVDHWCIHPGGRRILDTIRKAMQLPDNALDASYRVLNDYGNMSSPTILFVLKELMNNAATGPEQIFGAAFGPGLTMETFLLGAA